MDTMNKIIRIRISNIKRGDKLNKNIIEGVADYYGTGYKEARGKFDNITGAKNRKQAIETLITNVEAVCKSMGIKHMFSVGRNQHLINTHKKF